MSEHERPTAVSDDEQFAAPAHAPSADAPVAEPNDLPVSQPGDPVAPPADDAGPAERPPSPLTEVDASADVAAEAPDGLDSIGTATAADGRSTSPRVRKVVVIGVAAAALALAATFGPIAWEAWGHDDVRLVTTPRVAGLVLDDSQGAHDTIDYLRLAVQTGVSLEKSTGAVYADEAGQSRSVLFVGGTGSVSSPDDALTKTFRLISDDAGGVESVQSLSPGPLGGVMKCGSTKTDGGSMAVCGWADHRSLGIAMFPNRPVDQSADLLRAMRNVMQKGR
jgi:hypothetical protein